MVSSISVPAAEPGAQQRRADACTARRMQCAINDHPSGQRTRGKHGHDAQIREPVETQRKRQQRGRRNR
jgi:hypothetical protein